MEKEKQAESRSNQQISETRSRIDKIQARPASCRTCRIGGPTPCVKRPFAHEPVGPEMSRPRPTSFHRPRAVQK